MRNRERFIQRSIGGHGHKCGRFGPGEGFGPGEPGPGGFGPGGPGGFGPGGFGPRGPKGRHAGGPVRRRRGDVRLALLMLLAQESPLNGYQLMQKLEDLSEGRWRPSPGSVYPALSQLEDEGLISSAKAEGDSGHAYELTDAGREHLAKRGETKAPWEPQQGEDVAPRIAIRNGVIGVGRASWHVAQDGTPEQIEETAKILEEARRKLYRLLAGDE